jgi:CHASE2 domain-containing sensor protein
MADYDNDETPPVGEEIHLPGPSILPLAVGIAITCIVIGTTLGWWLSIIGLIVFLVATGIWIRDTRRDIEDLPEDHHGH